MIIDDFVSMVKGFVLMIEMFLIGLKDVVLLKSVDGVPYLRMYDMFIGVIILGSVVVVIRIIINQGNTQSVDKGNTDYKPRLRRK